MASVFHLVGPRWEEGQRLRTARKRMAGAIDQMCVPHLDPQIHMSKPNSQGDSVRELGPLGGA